MSDATGYVVLVVRDDETRRTCVIARYLSGFDAYKHALHYMARLRHTKWMHLASNVWIEVARGRTLYIKDEYR